MITETEVVARLLDRLAELREQEEVLAEEKKRVIETVITPEIKQALQEIDDEFSEKTVGLMENIATSEKEIGELIVSMGATVKGKKLMGVFNKGRVSWDTKELDRLVKYIPGLADCRKEGNPYCAIRKV